MFLGTFRVKKTTKILGIIPMQNFVLIQKNYDSQRALRARKVDNWSDHRSSLWTAGLTPGAPVDHPGD